MSAPIRDTLISFDVAAEDGSGFTPWEVELTRADAERFAAQVAEDAPGDTVTFCGECPEGPGSPCPHGTEHISVRAIGNLRVTAL